MSSIPFSRIIFSGLHAEIGIGNRIIKHLEEFIDIDVEDISPRIPATCIKDFIQSFHQKIRDLKEVWKKSPDGG